jgi:hypothetical protein
MKKIWLLTTLLVGGLLFTGCNKSNSEIDKIRTLELPQTEEYQQLEGLRETLTEEDIAEYTWIFHNNYIDDDYQYLWDILITWDTHWKLRGYKWDTWYIYNYTFDAWW